MTTAPDDTWVTGGAYEAYWGVGAGPLARAFVQWALASIRTRLRPGATVAAYGARVGGAWCLGLRKCPPGKPMQPVACGACG